MKRPFSFQRGFSLVELLIVLAIAALLVGLSLISLSGTSKQQTLDAGGSRIVDLVNEARQDAMSKRTMSALVMAKGTNNPALDNRAFVIEEYDSASQAWRQASKWELLPPGIVADSTGGVSTFITTPPTLNSAAALPTLSYAGQSIAPAQYAYQVFLSKGNLAPNASTTSPVLKLVSGIVNSGAVTYTSNQSGGAAVNYFSITINLYTGIPVINRP